MTAMRIAAVNMQRNEMHCLRPWALYHGYLFGFENIFIIDHASDAEKTIMDLRYLESCGVSIVRLPGEANYRDKGRFVAEEIHRIEKIGKFDFVFPIDCDEFLFLNDAEGRPTCCRTAMVRYLENFRSFSGALEIKENYLHILGHPGYFWSQPYQKIFFAGGACLSLDHGSHTGTMRESSDLKVTRFAYAHFHFKPYHVDKALSRAKLRPWVDVDNLEAVRTYDGPGVHLKHHLLCSEEEYYSGFRLDDNAIYFAELVNIFKLLGIEPNFSNADIADPGAVEADIGKRHGSMLLSQPDIRQRNIAFGKSATQSSISEWSRFPNLQKDASGAVSGQIDGMRKFHTGLEDRPWWQVDLGGYATIREIRIFNTVEPSAGRFKRFSISVSIDEAAWVEIGRKDDDAVVGGVTSTPYIWSGPGTAWARFVRVTLLGYDYLHLDQVEVYGEMAAG